MGNKQPKAEVESSRAEGQSGSFIFKYKRFGGYEKIINKLRGSDIMKKAVANDYSGSDADKAVIENLVIILRAQNLKNNRPIQIHPVPPIIGTKYEHIGYKLVALKGADPMMFMFEENYCTDVLAIIQISFTNNIAYGEDGRLVMSASDLKQGNKYCTDKVICNAVQLIGPVNKVMKTQKDLKDGKLKLVSVFDGDFEYKIGCLIQEPKFLEQGNGCVQGIHFFIDKPSAIKYVKTGFGGIEPVALALTASDAEGHRDYEEEIKIRRLQNGNEWIHFTNRFREIQPQQELEPGEPEPVSEVKEAMFVYGHQQRRRYLMCDVCKHPENGISGMVINRCGHTFHVSCVSEKQCITKKCGVCDADVI